MQPIPRRSVLGLPLVGILGGKDKRMAGSGGTPPRPAGYTEPSLPGVAPGSSSQVVRARLVIIGSSGPGTGEFLYDTPTPQANHLIGSDCGAATIDPAGNYALPGRTSYRNLGGGVFMAANMNPTGVTFGAGTMVGFFSASTQQGPANPWTFQSGVEANNAGTIWLGTARGDVLQLDSTGTVTLAPFSGQGKYIAQNGTGTLQLQCDASGIPQVVNGNDVQTYILGHSLKRAGANIPITSTTPTALITYTQVNVGFYKIDAEVLFSSATGTIQPFAPRIAGNCTLDIVQLSCDLVQTPISGANLVTGEITAQNADPNGNANLANSLSYRWGIRGFVHVSAIGNLQLTGRQATSAADEQFTVGANTWMELKPS